jgi:hypothetical protein
MRHLPLHGFAVALATAAAALVAAAAPARAASVCGEGTYAYAGFALDSVTHGVSASIAQAGPLEVRAGHVAGWIGVVAPDIADGWLQVGLSARPGDTTSQIYYEVASPGKAPAYHDVGRFVGTGQPHRFAVLELRRRPGWWRVWVDGEPATAPIHLRRSHNRWTTQVTGESWTGQTSGPCNRYAYAFTHVSLRGSDGRPAVGLVGSAQDDPNYTLVHRTRSSFVATSGS